MRNFTGFRTNRELRKTEERYILPKEGGNRYVKTNDIFRSPFSYA